MGLRGRLSRLEEQTRRHYEVLRLPDGTQVRYTSEDLLDALSAAMAQEGHWLLPSLLRADTNNLGLVGLIGALEASWARAGQEGEEGGGR